MLHDDLKDDYSFRTNIQDIASLLSGILNIMQQANLTDKELAELEQLYNERYETNKFRTVNYNGVEYSLSDESTYRKYHGRIGQTVSAVLVTKTYDDGEVRQYINRLGGL